MHKILSALPQKFFSILALSLGSFILFYFTAQAQTEVVGLVRQNCTGYANCYTSLSAWETAYGGVSFGACAQGDLVCAGRIAVAQIDGAWTNADTVGTTIDGWTTDATHYIQISTTQAARHSGKWDDGKYRIITSPGITGSAIRLNEANVKISGLQILVQGTSNYAYGIYVPSGSHNVTLSENIIQSTNTGAYGHGVLVSQGLQNFRMLNSIIYNFTQAGIGGGYSDNTAPDYVIYNNTIARSLKCYFLGYGSGVLYRNNIAQDCGTGFDGSGLNSDYNISDLAGDAPGTHSKNSTSVLFVNETNGDYHLSSSDTVAKDAGTDLSANSYLSFSTDIDGQTRSGVWDIGADEYIGAAPPSCTESWTCAEWSACSGSTQTRTCTDANACGTVTNRPALSQSCSTTDTQAPSVPTNLTATVISSSQINLSWTASTDSVGVTGYRIYRNGTQIGTSAVASYSNTGLTAATAYSFTVAAYDAAGNSSAQTNAAGATTQPASSTPPPAIQTLVSSVDGGTLGIPRWKMFMDPANSNRLWALVADDHDQLLLSNDGGVSWTGFTDSASQTYASRYAGEIRANIDYHASLAGDSSGNLFVVYPTSPSPYALYFRRISAPANASSLIGSEWSVPVDANFPKSGNVVVTDTDVWVFSRTSYETTAGNVRYSRYDKNGTLVSQGYVTVAGSSVRIGAINYKGNPLVVVWYCSQKLRYFLWNGASFVAPSDSLIWEANTSTACQSVSDPTWLTRNYTFTITSDDTLHASWLQTGNQLRHAWKTLGAAGSWNYDDVYNDTAAPQYSSHDFLPAATAFGRDMFVFYSLEASGSSGLTSDIYYRRWDGSVRAWGNQVRVSTDGANNLHANTVAVVNPASDYIPVMWTTGSTWDTTAARFTRISVQAQAPSCTESWTCAAWSTCANSTQTRSCTDSNNCGTIINRPVLSQSCTAPNQTPIGYLDFADVAEVRGWAYDPDSGTNSISVDIYIDGVSQARLVANTSRTDLVGQVVNGVAINGANHGFIYTMPTTLTVGTHTIRAYAINNPSGTNPELTDSPRTITIAPACAESWTCAAWSACVNNTQTRTCTDANSCGTTTNRPALSQNCGQQTGAPAVSSVSGTVSHGSNIIIQGSNFGAKATAAPYVWDDASGNNINDKWDFAYPYLNDVAYRLAYRTPQEVTKANGVVGGAPLPHSRNTKYIAGAHYNSGAVNVHTGGTVTAGKNNQQSYTYSYISFYQMIDPDWNHLSGSDYNFKEYDYAAGNGYMGNGPNLYFDNKSINNPTVQWEVNYVEGMSIIIYSVNTALVNWYPETGMVFPRVSVPGPKQWRKVEYVLKHNSADGFHQIYQNNRLIWEVFLDDDGLAPGSRSESVIGGYVREAGNTELFKNNWRYYSDVYYDHSLARVMLANNQNYDAATIIEPQIPSVWSSGTITTKVNLGRLPNSGTVYMFIFDPNNQRNTTGYPVTLGTTQACVESWICAAWSACANSTQTRTCTDANACGTTTNRPTLSQSCVSPSTAFSINDRVQTNASLNVRATPSISGTLVGTQALGNRGVIIGGSTRADNYWWWQVNYDTGADGWSVEDGLDLAPSVCTESWTCAAWSACVNSAQTQTCTDANACGTTVNRPALSQSCAVTDTTAPTVPTGLTATAVSSSQINLTWTASTDNVAVTGYRIYRNGTQVGTSATASYSNTGLIAATIYSFTVSAYDASGNASAQTSAVSATTLTTQPGIPVVSSLTGTPTNNNIITISGSNFGTKTQAAPLLWDNFEQGITGDSIENIPAVIGTWDASGTFLEPVYSTNMPRTGSKSSYHDMTNYGSTSLSKNLVFSKLYMDFWLYIDYSDIKTRNWKPWRFYGDNDQLQMNSGYIGNDFIFVRYDALGSGMNIGDWVGQGYEDKKWYHYEIWYDESDPGVTNGDVHHFINSKLHGLDSSSVMTRTFNHSFNQIRIGHYWAKDGVPGYPANLGADIYVDDVYIDTSWARVVIGDTSSWNTNTHREIQITSAWSANSISIAMNQGTFASGQQAYLYVIDANGNMNAAGYPISIGGTTTPACVESWICTAWSACSNTTQTRTCTDANVCGTTTNRPALSQSCIIPSATFSINDRVQTNTFLNVRATPSISGTLSGNQALGSRGIIIGDPARADNYWWWQVNYDTGVDGWSVEDGLDLAPLVCTESWICAAWSACSNSSQTRTCTDANACGTTTSRPTLTQTCTPPDITAPVISSIFASSLTTNSAVITWRTNEASDTQLEYGIATSYGQISALQTSLTSTHSVALTGLSAGTTYQYRVISKDATGNIARSSNTSFSTLPAVVIDTTPPRAVIDLSPQNITQTSVDLITWTAPGDDGNTGTAYAYDVRYLAGILTAANFASGNIASGLPAPLLAGTRQTYVLVGLAPGTTYSVALKTRDEANNWSDISNIVTFTTQSAVPVDTTSPVISAITVSALTHSSAIISWTTDETSNSQIEYGATASYGQTSSLNTNLVINHAVNISGLLANTQYHYRIRTRDASGNISISQDNVFSTLAAPDTQAPTLNSIATLNITQNSATITWATDELADTGLEYGQTTGYGFTTAITNTGPRVTSHIVTLSGLNAQTTYHFRAISKDAAGNTRRSEDITFVTAAASPPIDTTAPVINNIALTNVTAISSVISFTTNEPATSIIEWGKNTDYAGTAVASNTLTTSHTMTLANLSRKTAYNFRIRATDAAGNVSLTNNNTVNTQARLPRPPKLKTLMAAQGSVRLSWSLPEDDDGVLYELASKVEIYRSTNSYIMVPDLAYKVADLSPTETSWTDTQIQYETTYYYTLFVIDDQGNSSDAAQISFTPQAPTIPPPASPSTGGSTGSSGGSSGYVISDTTPPPAVSEAKADGLDGQIVLSWVNPTSSDYVRTIIVKKEGSDAPASINDGQKIYEGNASTFTDIQLINNQAYSYSIFAIDRVPNYSVAQQLTITPKTAVTQQNILLEADDVYDSDNDGLLDEDENYYGTDKNNPDTDGDSYNDKEEVDSGFDPLNPPGKTNQKLIAQIKGKILLQVQAHGEAWYVNPADGKRYYLRNGDFAYQIMRKLSLGITDKDLAKIPESGIMNQELRIKDTKLINRLKGKILLQVQGHGEAWYVNPADGKRYYMKDGAAAYEMMRNFGLGAKTADIIQVPYGRIK